MLIPKTTYIITLYKVSNIVSGFHETSRKFNLAIYLEDSGVSDIQINTVASRAQRYPLLMHTLMEHPFMGCFFLENSPSYDQSCAHLYWMNKLVTTGI